MGEMADLIDQWGEESEYKKVEHLLYKGRNRTMVDFKNLKRPGKGGYNNRGNSKPKVEKVTVGNIWMNFNPGYDPDAAGGKGTPAIFQGVYALRDNESGAKRLVEFAVWKRQGYNPDKDNDIIATGKDDQGNAVFLRVSSYDNIKFFGSVVAHVDENTLSQAPVFNFTLFDGDNSSAWSGTLQVEAGNEPSIGGESTTKKSNVTFRTSSTSDKPKASGRPKNPMPY